MIKLISKLFTRKPTRRFSTLMPAFLWQDGDGLVVKTDALKTLGRLNTSHTVEALASKLDVPVFADRRGNKFIGLLQAQPDCFGRPRLVGTEEYLSRIFMLMVILPNEVHVPVPQPFGNVFIQETQEPIKRERTLQCEYAREGVAT